MYYTVLLLLYMKDICTEKKKEKKKNTLSLGCEVIVPQEDRSSFLGNVCNSKRATTLACNVVYERRQLLYNMYGKPPQGGGHASIV